jgi:organic hydroperoxide reductase OsmC/OhrA
VLDTFEEFCTVSQSIKTGVDVQVAVHDADGVKIK